MTNEDRVELIDACKKAERAALGDSNDAEISALSEALDIALRLLGVDVEADLCTHCGEQVYRFDKPPVTVCGDAPQGWATDDSGDPVADFVCPERATSARFPDGRPHEVTG